MSGRAPARKPSKLSRRRFLGASALALAGTAGIGAFESRSLEVTHNTLSLPNWDADGFRVAQLTDIHVDNSSLRDLARDAVQVAIQAKPDVFFFTGDFMTYGGEESRSFIREVFHPLHGTGIPAFAIFGNHDWTSVNDPESLDRLIREDTPLTLLRNKMAEVDGVSIAGMDDATFGKQRPDIIDRDRTSRSLIVLLHEPDYVTDMPSFASLQLSGHSHGGEVCLPGGIPVHTPAGAKQLKVGFYAEANIPTYVSRGTGRIGPFRMFCLPELSIFTIKKCDGPATIQCSA